VPKQIRDLLRAKTEGGRFRLAEVDPDSTPGLKSSWHEKKDLAKHEARLFKLQEQLYAEHKRALLIVLQGMDTSGKDGTIPQLGGEQDPHRDPEGDEPAISSSEARGAEAFETAAGMTVAPDVAHKKEAPGLATQGSFCCFVWLDGTDAASARALGARLDLEGHLLATAEAVEVTFGATPVEEEFLSVFGCDKAKATVRDQLLDGACRHFHLLSLELKANSTRRACSRNGACGERRYCTGYLEYTPSRYRLIPGVSARRRARD
jgi:hypothetical protein